MNEQNRIHYYFKQSGYVGSRRLFFCPLFRMKANPKTFKYLSFPKNYLSFLKAYVVKSSEKPGFRDFFDLSFLKIGQNLSFF